eukprot:g70906.t1
MYSGGLPAQLFKTVRVNQCGRLQSWNDVSEFGDDQIPAVLGNAVVNQGPSTDGKSSSSENNNKQSSDKASSSSNGEGKRSSDEVSAAARARSPATCPAAAARTTGSPTIAESKARGATPMGKATQGNVLWRLQSWNDVSEFGDDQIPSVLASWELEYFITALSFHITEFVSTLSHCSAQNNWLLV